MATKAKRKRNAKQNAAHQRAFYMRSKQAAEDRVELMTAFVAAAPEGIEEHISYRLAVEDGEVRLVWDLSDDGAAFFNEFAASIKMSNGRKVSGHEVMRVLSVHIGQKMIRRTYDGQKGE